jgi:hypothetical protein
MFDLSELNRAKSALSSNGIAYTVRTNSMTNTGRTHGAPGIRASAAYSYRIYVHRDDYGRAKRIITE